MTTKKTNKKATKKQTARTKAAAKKVTKKTTKKTTAKAAQSTTSKKTTKKKTTPKKTTKKASQATTKKAAKVSAKKTAAKKATANGKRVLVCAEGDQCFWVNDGQVVKDLLELRDAMKAMAEEVFAHHVTPDRNDFASWVEHVLEDAECAEALYGSQTKRGATGVITRHLKFYRY